MTTAGGGSTGSSTWGAEPPQEGVTLVDLIQLGVAAVAIAALVMLRRVARAVERLTEGRRASELAAPPASPPKSEVHPGGRVVKAPKELVAAWVQFLRDEVADAANGLNNRLAVIRGLGHRIDRSRLSAEQLHDLEQIEVEVERATAITAKLLSRVMTGAPDTVPQALAGLRARARRRGVILVIEDDDANREVITRLLTSAGHRVIPARDGLDAFPALELDAVDCIISDIRMPVLGGKGLFEQVEEVNPVLARRFVFVTGDYTRPETREFLERAGCPVIAKPFQIQALLDAVTIVLERAEVLKPTDAPPPTSTQEPSDES